MSLTVVYIKRIDANNPAIVQIQIDYDWLSPLVLELNPFFLFLM